MGLDIREIVTRKIIEGLEKGDLPWHQPWSSGAVNHDSNKVYRGLNQLTLSYTADVEGWVNRWITAKSIKKHGYRIGKGESPQYIAFFKWIDKKDDAGEKTGDKFPLLRYYKVWSISQLDEAEEIIESLPKAEEFEPVERAEEIVQGMPNAPVIEFGGISARYSPSTDKVHMPLKEDFNSPDNFYSALFHELAHSTGAENRLNRKIENTFGDEKYSLEELVAEFTSAFLCAEAGIDNTIQQSTAYIKHWLKVLKNDRQMLLTGASLAQKASDYILGITWD
jgi:antirestriction protein ArdC